MKACPPGHAIDKNNTCNACVINTYKFYPGTPCKPCKIGFDTNGMDGCSAKCNKTCTAGYYSLDNVYCKVCPAETYKQTL